MKDYSSKKLGQELKFLLDNGYNVIEISRWAYGLLYDYRSILSPVLKDVLKDIARMEDDPQFEYTESELKTLSNLLIDEVKDPLKKLSEVQND